MFLYMGFAAFWGLMIATATSAASVEAAIHPDCSENTFRLCLLPDPDAQSVLVALTLPVGSADEGAGENGMAHYVEHLTFRNRKVEAGEPTPGRAGIDRWGNAHTTPWATTYHWTVPPERAEEAVARALAVLAPLDVSEEAAAQERAIVQREREQRHAGADARRAEAIDAALYSGNPLERNVIGTPGEIAALDLAAARAFHERHYRAGDATLVVAGPVDEAAIRAAVEKAAEGLDRTPGTPQPVALDLPPLPLEARHLTDRFGAPERTLDVVAPTPDDHATLAATGVLDAWLASSLPGAPYSALVRERDDLRDASAAVWEVVPGWTGLGVALTLRPSLDAAALDAPWAAWEALWADLVRDGLDEATVERLRARLLRDVTKRREDGQEAAWDLIAWLESGETVADWESYPDALAAVSAADVDALLAALAEPARHVTTDAVPGPPGAADPAPPTPARAPQD